MNKTALKNFATSARNELIKKVEARALKIGITEESIKKAQFESLDAIYIDGKQLSITEKKQRDKLIQRIREIGFKNVMEEVAYTWFNRFIALRFMEVNNYLPTKVRVLSSSEPGNPEPDIIKEALSVDLDIDKELVYDLKLNNKTEELFKYMVIKQCNDLNKYLSFMFETIEDYKEVLFPDSLLSPDSFVRQVTNVEIIPEEDWVQIEIIGWLYQYYNTELNELVYDGSMSKNRVPKELLPAATQLFTPDWAVQYMVENSLGRLWLQEHHDENLKNDWKYYLDKRDIGSGACQEGDLGTAKKNNLNPEEIKLFDPCMGSGHILVYAFEILMQIYQTCGYLQRDAAKLILERNLYGLEIDDRAYQLACFALMMKARKYNRRIFNEEIELNLCPIVESNELENVGINLPKFLSEDATIATTHYLISLFHDAKEYGSILGVEERDYDSLDRCFSELKHRGTEDLFELSVVNRLVEVMPKLVKQARIMARTYDVVITNPPYLGNARMSPLLDAWVKEYYPASKADLSMVLYQKSVGDYCKPNGFVSFITTTSWMFLHSFVRLRESVLSTSQIETLVDFGTELFDGKVGHNPIVSWVIRNSAPQNNMIAIRLVDFCYSKSDQKEPQYFNLQNRYYRDQKDFTKMPGSPIAYWVSEQIRDNFYNYPSVYSISTSASQNVTGNNKKYVRYFWEVNQNDIGKERKWIFYAKGGGFRKWTGNLIDLVDWSSEARNAYRTGHGSQIIPEEYWYKEGITWGLITSSIPSFRMLPQGSTFDKGGSSIFINDREYLEYVLGFLNSKIALELLKALNPSLNFQVKDIRNLPIKIAQLPYVVSLVNKCMDISKEDWDSFEISSEFKRHPMILNTTSTTLKSAYGAWEQVTEERFKRLLETEENINAAFIELYKLENEMNSSVNERNISVSKAVKDREIRSLISYAVGCMFGRYSLDEEGLVFAGGNFDLDRYHTYTADSDNILPILSNSYFEDDIVSRFVELVKVTFGEETLTENLEFIADTLGKKDSETSREAIRRYFLSDFFKDHVQTYKKKPIYWLFTSGKQKAFNCLIYMHRYDKTTVSRIRTDYVHELQLRFEAERKSLLSISEGDGTAREISVAKKELKTLELKIAELKEYEEVLHHMADQQIEIDLDDGVDVNYEKFADLLAKRK